MNTLTPAPLRHAAEPSSAAPPSRSATGLLSACKRGSEALETTTPAAKRSAISLGVPPASAGDEVHRLQAQVDALRQRVEEVQAEALKE